MASGGDLFSIKGAVELLVSPAIKQLDELDRKAKASTDGMSASFQRAQIAILKTIGPQVLGALGGVLAGIAKESFELGKQLVGAMAKFQGATGASIQEAQQFSRTLTNLWKGSAGDIASIGDTLTRLRQTFGDLGSDTEAIAKKFTDFSKITGADAGQSMTSAANLMRQLGIEAKDAGPLLDLVAHASQRTGVNAANLFRSLGAAQPAFQGLGMNLEEGTAYLTKFLQAGGDANDFVDSYLDLAEAMTKTTADQAKGFKDLGIALDASGKPAGSIRDVFTAVIDKMAKGEATSTDFKLAVKNIFGEDSGKKLLQAFSGIGAGLDELKSGLDSSLGTVEESAGAFETMGERLTKMFRELFGDTIQAGAELTVKALNGILDAMEWLVKATTDMGMLMGFTLNEVAGAASKMADGLVMVFDAAMNKVKDAIASVYELLLEAIRMLPDEVRGVTEELEFSAQANIESLRKRENPNANALQGLGTISDAATDLFGGDALGRAGTAFSDYLTGKEKEKAAAAEAEATKERERKAKEKADNDALAKAELLKRAKEAEIQDVKDSITVLEQEMALGKVSEQQAAARYRTILSEARKVGLEKQDLFDIEKSLYDLQSGINEDLRESAEKRQQAEMEMHLTWLKNIKGETAAALQELDNERAAREKLGVDRAALDAFYGAERQRIFKEDAKRREEEAQKEADALKKQEDGLAALSAAAVKSQQERLEAQGKTLQAQLLGLDQEKAELIRGLTEQRDAIIKANGDKLTAEQQYQDAVVDAEKTFLAKRQKLLDDAAKARKKLESDVQQEILRLKAQAIAATDPEKAAELTGQADREKKLQAVTARAAELKKQGIDPTEYLKAEAAAVLAGPAESGVQTGEKPADPYGSMNSLDGDGKAKGTGGFSLPTFSNESSGRRRRASREEEKLAQDILNAASVPAVTPGVDPAQARADKLRAQGHDVKGPLTKEEQEAITRGVNGSGFLDALKTGVGYDATGKVSSLDPATRAASSKAGIGAAVGSQVAKSPAGKAPSSLPTAEVNLTVNVMHDGRTEQTANFNSTTTPKADMASTYVPGRLG